MSVSPPVAVLTQANPAYQFFGPIGGSKRIATSGATGAGVIKVQQRNRETDAWVDNPNLEYVTGKHLAGILTIVAPFNRIVVATPDGTTNVAIFL